MTRFDGARVRLALLAVVVVAVIAGAAVWRSSSDGGDGAGEAAAADVGTGGTFDMVAYEGLGTWVDVFDYAPAYQQGGLAPPITPQDMAAMAGLGVRTLYLQAARFDDRAPDGIVDRDLVGQFLEAAHDNGIRVVGWYLPKFHALDADTRRLNLIVDFEWNGHKFDGITVDIEDVENVPDVAERNTRLIELSRRLRERLGPDAVIGAGVLPPVQIEVVNLQYWPSFPWKELDPYYDVWLPMAYWSVRNEASGYKHGYTYVEESVRRLRANLGDPDAAMHPIGGIGDGITEGELRDYLRALTDTDALGGSIYDHRTMNGGHWGVLRGIDAALEAEPPPPTTLLPPPTAPASSGPTTPVSTAPPATQSSTAAPPPATSTVPGG